MRAVLLCSALLLATAADAQEAAQSPAPAPDAPARVVVAPVTRLDFTAVDVVGELHGPSGQYVVDRRRAKFRNLIALRAHFRREILQSAHALGR